MRSTWTAWTLTALLAGLAAGPALAWDDDCDYTAERQATLDADGATRLRIEARAGSLSVTGKAGSDRVEITGTACSSRESKLDDIRLDTRRRGDTLVVEVEMPESWGWSSTTARLDLEITAPRGLAVEIDDTSGSIFVAGVRSLEIEDGSGGIEVERVAGAVTIDDGSGEIEVFRIEGPLDIDDGSGSIRAEEIAGDVELRDGSGSIEVHEVGGSVRVRSDGSGSIRVTRVEGDFRVDSDGSGGVSYDRIGGRVSVP